MGKDSFCDLAFFSVVYFYGKNIAHSWVLRLLLKINW